MSEPLFDPALLRSFGGSPEEVRRNLALELEAFEQQLRARQADWTRVQAGREWSPAQELEHVMAVGQAGGRAVKLLLSERELRAFPRLQGELRDGKRQTPDFARPSEDGLPWASWLASWQAHRQELEAMAANVRATPDRRLWHPYFGELDALDWLRSLVGHVRGHRELLERSAAQ